MYLFFIFDMPFEYVAYLLWICIFSIFDIPFDNFLLSKVMSIHIYAQILMRTSLLWIQTTFKVQSLELEHDN